MWRARVSVAGGVGGTSSILKSGWNAVKCSGTSAPRCSTIQRRQLVDLVVAVVVAGDEQRGDLHPHAVGDQPLQRVEHRLQVAAAHLPVEVLGERLQVDVDGIHPREQLLARPVAHVAGADRDRADAGGVAGVGDVDRVLEEDDRVVVGEGDAGAALRRGRAGDASPGSAASASVSISRLLEMSQFWQKRQARLQPAVPKENTDVPGQEVVERLLLDRVDAEPARPTVGGEHDLVTLAGAHEAQTPLALVQLARSRAHVALDPPVVQAGPPTGGEGRRRSRSHLQRAPGLP